MTTATSSDPHRLLSGIDDWPVPNVSAAVLAIDSGQGRVVATRGELDRRYRLASIAKLITSYALLVALEEEAIGLDDPAGPPGSTVAHLLAHTSGLGFDRGDPTISAPGARRIYSNAGIETAAEHLTARTGIAFTDYLGEAVLAPLGMADTTLDGSPAHAVHSTLTDLVAFARELLNPTLVHPDTLRNAIEVQFPGVVGVIPGVGRFDPCDWGYGFERNFGRPRHWAGERVSRDAYGHFGGAGTFFWIDPVHARAAICLTDRPFDSWALQVWPPLCNTIIEADL